MGLAGEQRPPPADAHPRRARAPGELDCGMAVESGCPVLRGSLHRNGVVRAAAGISPSAHRCAVAQTRDLCGVQPDPQPGEAGRCELPPLLPQVVLDLLPLVVGELAVVEADLRDLRVARLGGRARVVAADPERAAPSRCGADAPEQRPVERTGASSRPGRRPSTASSSSSTACMCSTRSRCRTSRPGCRSTSRRACCRRSGRSRSRSGQRSGQSGARHRRASRS